MNIDFTDNDISYDARPHRNMWIGVLLLAFEEAVNDKPNTGNMLHQDWKYQALDWWYNTKYTEDRKAVFALAGQDLKSWQDRLTRTLMHRMPDHITDGPQTPEDAAEMWDTIFERIETEPTDEDLDRMTEERDGRL